jgi:hypothetical protein
LGKNTNRGGFAKDIESRKFLFRNKEGITTTYFSEDIICEIPNHF